MSTEIINGSRQSFGVTAATDNVEASKVIHAGVKRELVCRFPYDNLPAGYVDDHSLGVPAGALVTACYVRYTVDFDSTSGTSVLDIGLYDNTGTAIDADGLMDSGAAADGTNVGWYVGAGADIGTVPSATLAGYLFATPSVDDLIAGEAIVVVEYIDTAV